MSKSLAIAGNDFLKSNGLRAEDTACYTVGPSMTRQEFAEDADVNNIVKRYDAHMADPTRSIREPIYYDFTVMPETLMDAMTVLQDGEKAFMTLPASVRKEFDNNPAAFVDYASDPGNVDQMREWGLAKPLPEPEKPMRVEVTNPAPAAEASPGASKAP